MKPRMRMALLALLALCLAAAAALADKTVYLSGVDTSITVPEEYYPLYEGMSASDPTLSVWGLTARQAKNYLSQQGSLLEAQSEDGTDYILRTLDMDPVDLSGITTARKNRLLSELESGYRSSGITLSDSGLYKGNYGNLLRYTLSDGSAAWLEYVYGDGRRMLSLLVYPKDGRVTSSLRKTADAVAVTVRQGGAQATAAPSRAAATAAGASLSSVTFAGEGLSVGLPGDYTVYLRDALLKDSSFSSELTAMIRGNEAILGLAASKDGNSEYWILSRKAELYDLSAVASAKRTDALRGLATALSAGVLDPDGVTGGGTYLSETAYDFAGCRWHYGYSHWTAGNFDEYALSAATLRRGREIALLFIRYDGEVTREDRNQMNAVVQSVSFSDAKPGKSRTLTDPATGARFALPGGYQQEGSAFVPEKAGGLSFVYAAADVASQAPETDPSVIDTVFYSKRDMASLYQVGVGDVSARILNGEIWYRIDTAVSREVYGVTASVPETDYVTVRAGKMHLLAFVGPKEAAEAADPETVAAGARLPQ